MPWEQSPEMRLAVVIVDVTRELARSMPPPRGAPYFCLDSDAAYDLHVLDALYAQGIFRKYEFALDIGSGLGGRARWLAARSGCRIVGVEPHPPTVAAAALLNHRVRMDEQVTFQVGRPECIPVRARLFTHVWLVDPAPEAAVSDILAEAFRVLRHGGHFAVQCPMPPAAVQESILATLGRVGFVDIEASSVTGVEPPHACRVARARLSAAVHRRLSRAMSDERPAIAPPVRPPHRLQIFARRFT